VGPKSARGQASAFKKKTGCKDGATEEKTFSFTFRLKTLFFFAEKQIVFGIDMEQEKS